MFKLNLYCFLPKGISSWTKEKLTCKNFWSVKSYVYRKSFSKCSCLLKSYNVTLWFLYYINNVLFKVMVLRMLCKKCHFVNIFSSNLSCRISAWTVASSSNILHGRCSISVQIISNCGKYHVYVQSAIKG